MRVPPVGWRIAEGPAVPVGSPFTVVHEDDALLVVDKAGRFGGSWWQRREFRPHRAAAPATPGGAIPRAGASSSIARPRAC